MPDFCGDGADFPGRLLPAFGHKGHARFLRGWHLGSWDRRNHRQGVAGGAGNLPPGVLRIAFQALPAMGTVEFKVAHKAFIAGGSSFHGAKVFVQEIEIIFKRFVQIALNVMACFVNLKLLILLRRAKESEKGFLTRFNRKDGIPSAILHEDRNLDSRSEVDLAVFRGQGGVQAAANQDRNLNPSLDGRQNAAPDSLPYSFLHKPACSCRTRLDGFPGSPGPAEVLYTHDRTFDCRGPALLLRRGHPIECSL